MGCGERGGDFIAFHTIMLSWAAGGSRAEDETLGARLIVGLSHALSSLARGLDAFEGEGFDPDLEGLMQCGPIVADQDASGGGDVETSHVEHARGGERVHVDHDAGVSKRRGLRRTGGQPALPASLRRGAVKGRRPIGPPVDSDVESRPRQRDDRGDSPDAGRGVAKGEPDRLRRRTLSSLEARWALVQ